MKPYIKHRALSAGLGRYLETTDAEEEHQQPCGPDGPEVEEEQQHERRRDDEHERRFGLQLHDLGLGFFLSAQRRSLLGRLLKRTS
jgi:hypothetical protein